MNSPEHIIDARGHRCPVPTLKLRKLLENLATGTVVNLWVDDPMAQIDVPHFCNKNNYIITSFNHEDEFMTFVVTSSRTD
jgi:tRNA 2-thiouridine synthesizing protein A